MLDPKTCKPGQEQFEEFSSSTIKRVLVQYDYRTLEGKLFSCIAWSLDDARVRRDHWLERAEECSAIK